MNSGTWLDGFFVEDGYAHNDGAEPGGAGLLIKGGSLQVKNCTFRKHFAVQGAGVYIRPSTVGAATPYFENCKFFGNEATSDGGGMYGDGVFELYRCVFDQANKAERYGGALVVTGSTTQVHCESCAFVNNRAEGTGVAGGCGGTIRVATGATLKFVSSTVAHNTTASGQEGAGVCTTGGNSLHITNGILWDNKDDGGAEDFKDQVSGSVTGPIDFSDVKGITLPNVDKNIDEDPEFVTSTSYRIQSTSPCLDAGSSGDVTQALDVFGHNRIQNCRVDHGSHEIDFLGGACCVGQSCSAVEQRCECVTLVCNVADHLPPTFLGCFGDADGNGTVNAADRGFISANIGQTDPDKICRFDMDGNGSINAGDRGFVSANIGLCSDLPDYQNGSGLNHGEHDTRFPGNYLGDETTCGPSSCDP